MTPLIVLWGRRADTDVLAEEEWYKKATYVVVFPKATIYRLYLLYKASCCSYCNKSIKPTLNTESLFCPRNGSSNGGVKHAVFMVYRETSFFPLFLSFLASARLACRRGVEGAKLQIFNGWLSTTINRPATRSLTVLLRKRAVRRQRGGSAPIKNSASKGSSSESRCPRSSLLRESLDEHLIDFDHGRKILDSGRK